MSNTRLFLLAGSAGSGKSEFIRRNSNPEYDIAAICYDLLMHDAIAFAFPHFVGGRCRWSKDIWAKTKDLIDAHAAMLRAIRHFHRYEREASGNFRRWVFYGYQLADRYWIDVATSLTTALAGEQPTTHICWMRPPLDTVIRQRHQRDFEHDRVSEEEMATEYNAYEHDIGDRYDSLACNDDEAFAQIAQFFDMAT